MKRSAGVLLAVSSLPSKYGIGCFDETAYDFVDWLADAGQTYWQILPLAPPVSALPMTLPIRLILPLRETLISSAWTHLSRRACCLRPK